MTILPSVSIGWEMGKRDRQKNEALLLIILLLHKLRKKKKGKKKNHFHLTTSSRISVFIISYTRIVRLSEIRQNAR